MILSLIIKIATTVVVVATLAPCAFAQARTQNVGTLAGEVVDAAGQRIPGAVIVLEAPGGQRIETTSNAPTHLWLAVEGADGQRVMTSAELPAAGGASVRQVVPFHVWIVVVLFAATCAVVCIAWYRWIQRSTSAAARRVGARAVGGGGTRPVLGPAAPTHSPR